MQFMHYHLYEHLLKELLTLNNKDLFYFIARDFQYKVRQQYFIFLLSYW